MRDGHLHRQNGSPINVEQRLVVEVVLHRPPLHGIRKTFQILGVKLLKEFLLREHRHREDNSARSCSNPQ